jgi:hypothetical protein
MLNVGTILLYCHKKYKAKHNIVVQKRFLTIAKFHFIDNFFRWKRVFFEQIHSADGIAGVFDVFIC